MSLNAMIWALHLKPQQLGTVTSAAHVTLLALADYAGPDGRGAWPSAATLAEQRGLSVRQIRRHLETLEEAGLILRGDQTAARNLPANKRPTVWDLACGKPDIGGDTHDTPTGFGGDTHDTPNPSRGDIPSRLGVTSDVTQTVNKPSIKSNQVRSPRPAGQRRPAVDSLRLKDYPGRDCVHGAAAEVYHDKRRQQILPRCPICRHVGHIMLDPIEQETLAHV